MQSTSNISYRIDREDVIVFVSEAWDRFALRNDAPDVAAEKILRRSLWDFIKDETTGQLYREMLKIVRGGKILQFNFNCDSPDKIRFMEMIVSAEKNGGVQFQTRTLRIQTREPQTILDRNAARTIDLVHICGWCKSIETAAGEWKDLDEAISLLGLFGQDKLPALTHGMCTDCYLYLSKKITERKNF